ncbi:hypothetical protein PRJBM_01579 [Bartonella henselae]|nr:hypothetical protein Q654_01597 [Bartonella henselae JK 50]ETS05026.1 hypothetical protein Q655_01544 [Bartonella henselae JK 51]CDO40924.1 hypothetical protein PRJBM_01579 [Bartonella henselae]CUH91498.1 hypothetical protein BM1374164_01579 [Bartonella henselae]
MTAWEHPLYEMSLEMVSEYLLRRSWRLNFLSSVMGGGERFYMFKG